MGMITDHVSVYVFVCVRGIENGTALYNSIANKRIADEEKWLNKRLLFVQRA